MLKVIKRAEVSSKQAILQKTIAIICALLAVCVIIACIGYNPFEIFYRLIEGSIFSTYRLQETLIITIPLVVLSLGVAIAFKMRFWNIGGEGQFYTGAFAATFIALNFSSLPKPIVLILMFIAAIIAGGIWSAFPAFLKAKLGTNETLVTLMLNYVAIKWVTYLQNGPWRDPNGSGFPRIARFEDSAVLPDLFGVHIGWIIALVLVVLVHILLNKTKLGYEMAVVGENEQTARYAGMNVAKILVVAVFFSGALCGVAGMMQASAVENSLSSQLSAGLGYTAIITCWLARLKPATIVIVSFLFAMLVQGGTYLQSSMQVPSAVASIIQAVILFFVLGSEFFTQYKIVRKHQ